MPIYEFRCNDCQAKSSVFLRSISQPLVPICPSCDSKNLTRLISTFAYHKSGQSRLEEAGEPQMFPKPDYYKDPRNIGRWAEKRLKDLGVDIPSKTKEMIEAAREGKMPEPLKDL